jgi:RNA polymerase sigma-70 factor (ECF subfamily)
MTALAGISIAELGDDEIARLCAAREPTALRHVVKANNQRLFRAAWSILKDRSEAEEAVQSAYLKAFAGISGFAGRSALSTWLTRIVVNESFERLRSRRRRKEQLAADGISILESYRDSLMRGSDPAAPDAAMAVGQLRLLIERAVAALPDAFRCVFVLREVEGLSVQETAEALEIPPATVKTRLLRARRRLQESLEPGVRSALEGAFPFAGADCDTMTERVLGMILDG